MSDTSDTDETDKPLYRALVVERDLAKARALLEAGHDPDDGESLYHAAEGRDLAALELLWAFGVDLNAAPALLRKLDWEDPAGLAWLLERGADPEKTFGLPDGDTALHHAIRRGRSAKVVTLLLDAGADLEAPRGDGLSPYRHALRAGRAELTELLARRGADLSVVTPADELLGAAARGDRRLAAELGRRHPQALGAAPAEAPAAACEAAWHGRLRALLVFLELGWPLEGRGQLGGTALHQASFRGHAEIVRLLAARGALLETRCTAHGATPLEWCGAGSLQREMGAFGGDPEGHPDVARALVEAGARLPDRIAASEPVLAVLQAAADAGP